MSTINLSLIYGDIVRRILFRVNTEEGCYSYGYVMGRIGAQDALPMVPTPWIPPGPNQTHPEYYVLFDKGKEDGLGDLKLAGSLSLESWERMLDYYAQADTK